MATQWKEKQQLGQALEVEHERRAAHASLFVCMLASTFTKTRVDIEMPSARGCARKTTREKND